MQSMSLFNSLRRVLCVGAHCDDIEIGLGGTILEMRRVNPNIEIHWAVFSGNETRHAECRESFKAFIPDAQDRRLILHSYRDGYFPSQVEAIKASFEELKSVEPDLVLTHTRFDRHQDHRVLSDLAWNTFRAHLIWEYLIPKWDGESMEPNLYVPVQNEQVARVCELLQRAYVSQRSKHWFDEETFRSVRRLRGVESNTRYAEAFIARKMVVGA